MPILPQTEMEPAGHGYKQARATCHLPRARVKAGHTENSHATQGFTERLRPRVKQAVPSATHTFFHSTHSAVHTAQVAGAAPDSDATEMWGRKCLD